RCFFFPGFCTNCCAHSTGQEERRCYRILLHTFIQSCFFFLHISPLFISPLFISPLFLYLPCLYISPEPWASHSFYTLSHPRTAGHAPSPVTRLQLIRAAGANLHQIGFTCILVHLCSSQDVCGLYEEVRCKSYDLAAVPGAFGTAATPAPNRPVLNKACFKFDSKIVV
ncbi:mCG1036303, partial [Mus musculus]